MLYLIAIIYGVVQGLTEFIPVSSSGHLVVLHSFLNIYEDNELLFDVSLHFGPLVALVLYFKKDLIAIAQAVFTKKLGEEVTKWNQRLLWYLFISAVPAALAGFFLEQYVLKIRTISVVIFTLVLGGILMLIVERFASKIKELQSLNSSKSFAIGIFQAVALIPGVSRSGITIIAGMIFGLKRELAARFAFLMAIPVVFGAWLKKIYDLLISGTANIDVMVIIIGFVSSLATGYLAIRFLLRFLSRRSLNIFAYYRFVLALLLIILVIMKIN